METEGWRLSEAVLPCRDEEYALLPPREDGFPVGWWVTEDGRVTRAWFKGWGDFAGYDPAVLELIVAALRAEQEEADAG